MDNVPHHPEREVTRSKQDQQAVALLDAKTVRTEVDGVRSRSQWEESARLQLLSPISWANSEPVPGSTLGASLVGVLLRFREHPIVSVCTPEEAKQLVECLRDLLSSAGFQLRQWACNDPSVLNHLPQEARSPSLDLWLAQDKANPQESTLGLSWHWERESLSYKQRPVSYDAPTLRNIYKVLASQYDPLGYLLPFSTRAKLIIWKLWDKQRGWDDPNLPAALLQAWSNWEDELQFILNFTRAYMPPDFGHEAVTREVHIFANASEQAYGAVAYLRTAIKKGQVHLSFILARSRVASNCIHSIPRLELCAALVAAQLTSLLAKELTLEVAHTTLWSDSTTVLTWLHSQSCRFKVFVGAKVAEIQDLTENSTWRYVDSGQNPADELTRGKTLEELKDPNRLSQGPPFLVRSPDSWPERLTLSSERQPSVELQSPHLLTVGQMIKDTVPAKNSWKGLSKSSRE
ncbi:hypothetical protein JOB18_002350 [Solea senegalensis]|uniref:Uncharacterized protein n=1 Tax=Solea senegalensis TaxID=28829 RepID=A0AAV6RL46_SOLSE|nr:hypothetical protein JOB18_002350 [Solea senegalensis]